MCLLFIWICVSYSFPDLITLPWIIIYYIEATYEGLLDINSIEIYYCFNSGSVVPLPLSFNLRTYQCSAVDSFSVMNGIFQWYI